MEPEGFFPTNPDLADILGRTDLDFQIFWIRWTPNVWISKSQISRNLAWARLNRGLVANWPEEPSGPKHIDFLS